MCSSSEVGEDKEVILLCSSSGEGEDKEVILLCSSSGEGEDKDKSVIYLLLSKDDSDAGV